MSENSEYILVADDDNGVREFLVDTLKAYGYRAVGAVDGEEALRTMEEELPDLVITDVHMPRMDGFALCEKIKVAPRTRLIPVIMLTGFSGQANRIHGIEIGADEFLAKPFHPVELQVRVRSLLRLKRYTDELIHAEEVLFSLAQAVAAKDPYTQGHSNRISHNGVAVARRLGLPDDQIQAVKRGGFLHDIGKIGIPDSILQKSGGLNPEEFELMRLHPVTSENICRPLRTLAPALPVIRHHHERMDGKGYPDGLSGEEIPIGARIVAVVDLFDAIITDRPYAKGLPLKEACSVLHKAAEDGHLDPKVVDVFEELIDHHSEDLMLDKAAPAEASPPDILTTKPDDTLPPPQL